MVLLVELGGIGVVVGERRRDENFWFSGNGVGETENEGAEKIGIVTVTATVVEKSDVVLMLSTRDPVRERTNVELK